MNSEKPGPAPALRLSGIGKVYEQGGSSVTVLADISLDIEEGEFVAIMGQSGSGKSTLMNIMGCLDRPTSGSYEVYGRSVHTLDPDALAGIRRDTFGFVFQRYHLLPTETAIKNVEIPAVYAGLGRSTRRDRAQELLERLGMSDRLTYRPTQLSGGQQQRVAIARALMNNPRVVLADEPTGALDSRTGKEVLDLLQQLHGEGRTVILITHDEQVAGHAERIVRLVDGRIVSDSTASKSPRVVRSPLAHGREEPTLGSFVSESIRMALLSLHGNLLRTALTLLGVIIGVAAVVAMLAVGSGSKEKVLAQISSMGTNLLSVRPGLPGLRGATDVTTLTMSDADEIGKLPHVSELSPERSSRFTVRFGNKDTTTTVQGVGALFPSVREWSLADGDFFTERDLKSHAAVAVIGQTAAKNLFPEGLGPVGQHIVVKNVPFHVIGVMQSKGASPGGNDQDDAVFIPLSTGLVRLFGRTHLGGITIRVDESRHITEVETAIEKLLLERHRTEDFTIRNMASILETATETQNTLSILLAAVAAISLIVGGIGVMNIMLVSVTERTKEIGLRVATGARYRDILLQFNIEALVVCALGGVMGIALGLLTGWTASLWGVSVIFSVWPAVAAFSCASLTGLVFGYLPARKAARLDPVVALASE